MLKEINDRRREVELAKRIESRATRHLRGTDEYGYLLSDLRWIAELSRELRKLIVENDEKRELELERLTKGYDRLNKDLERFIDQESYIEYAEDEKGE